MPKKNNQSNTSPFGPMTINLTKKKNPKWIFPDEVNAKKSALEKLGFSSVGIFSIAEMQGVLMMAFTHRTEPLAAAVTEHVFVGVWSEIVAQYSNSDSLTVTNCPMSGLLDQMPGQVKITLTKKNEKDLFSVARKKLKPSLAVVVTRENFKAFFEDAYKKEMEWRVNKGVTEKEVKRVAAVSDGMYDGNSIRATVKTMNLDTSIPCANDNKCPYMENDSFEVMMEIMPKAKGKDTRKCPKNGRLCIDFISVVDISQEDVPDPESIDNIAAFLKQSLTKSIDITRETGDMKAAIQKANGSLDKFLKRARLGLPGETDFMLRVRLKKKTANEYVWVTDFTERSGRFNGVPRGESDGVASAKKGKKLAFARSQITDWAYRAGKFWEGDSTGAVLLKRMPKAIGSLEKELKVWSTKGWIGKWRAWFAAKVTVD